MAFDPIWAMLAISLATGVIMVWIFGKTSNQNAIKAVKDKIRGNVLAVRLYQHDLVNTLRLQRSIIFDTAIYIKHSLVPMLALIGPVLLIIIQLNLYFSSLPLKPEDRTLVKVTLRDAESVPEGYSLEAPEGVEVELSVASQSEVAWRIKGLEPGRYDLFVKMGDRKEQKELLVGERWGAVSTLRTGKGILDSLLYPGESTIPASSPVESIEIDYPALPLTVFGWNIHWLVFFFIASLIFGFAFKGVLGVQV